MHDENYHGDSEENVYDEDAREDSLDNDEISVEEEAFMKGYDEATDEKEKEKEKEKKEKEEEDE